MDKAQVSIPFREELHSDTGAVAVERSVVYWRFHPFQGRAPFGHFQYGQGWKARFYVVSIPFREDLYSDMVLYCARRAGGDAGFHPFQGRPLFGQTLKIDQTTAKLLLVSIPFREDLHSDIHSH